MLQCNYEHDYGQTIYPKEITTQASFWARDQLHRFHRHYFYQDVSLVLLENHGGDVAGLSILLDGIRELQSQGVRVETVGAGVVASAAAIALSFGTLGRRRVLAGAQLVYHNARIQGQVALTNQVARQLGKRLEAHDDQMLECVVAHCAPLARPAAADPDAADGPCGFVWPLRSVTDPNLPRVDLAQKRFDDLASCKQHMSATLRAIFETDTVIENETALALGLIDQVCTRWN